jgi:exopolysaccharide biosynthesis polyprenyl glycosylphosphotransferase
MLIAKRIHGLRSLQVAFGVVASLVLFWALILVLTLQRGWSDLNWSRYVIYSVLMVLGLLADFFRMARWEPRQAGERFRSREALRMALEQSFMIFVVLVGFLVAFKDLAISRLFLAIYLPLQGGLLYLINDRLPAWLGARLFRGARCQKTLLVGTAGGLRRLEPWMKRNGRLGLEPVGVVLSGEESAAEVCGIPSLGSAAELPRILRGVRVSLLIHTNPPTDPEELRSLRDECDVTGTRLVLAYDLGDELAQRASFFSEGGRHFMSLRPEPLEAPANRIFKRALDVVASLFVVVFILPFTTLLVWLLQRLQAPGPLLFRQTRSGLHNEEFTIYKYRTMYADNAEPHVQAVAGDPRVFPAGRWLRRLSLDELPQFVNVLLGEMSIVGPRPHMLEHDRNFSESDRRYRVRHLVKPGITGLAQVRGLRGETRDDADVVSRTSADLQYLENWSLALDLVIIARTVVHVFRAPRSAC